MQVFSGLKIVTLAMIGTCLSVAGCYAPVGGDDNLDAARLPAMPSASGTGSTCQPTPCECKAEQQERLDTFWEVDEVFVDGQGRWVCWLDKVEVGHVVTKRLPGCQSECSDDACRVGEEVKDLPRRLLAYRAFDVGGSEVDKEQARERCGAEAVQANIQASLPATTVSEVFTVSAGIITILLIVLGNFSESGSGGAQ